jgi:hypothetical protein
MWTCDAHFLEFPSSGEEPVSLIPARERGLSRVKAVEEKSRRY